MPFKKGHISTHGFKKGHIVPKEWLDKIKKFKKGKHFSPKTEFKKGFAPWNKGLKGYMAKEKNPNWKGGRIKNGQCYIKVYSPNHPFNNQRYVLEHRLVMEKHLGRYLKPQEVVHHINENPSDNHIKNLLLFPNSGSHSSFHHALTKRLS